MTLTGADTVGVELENVAVTDRVNGTGAARVTAERGTRQAEAGREIFRSGPDGLLVEDDGLPLLIRTHSGQHARNLPRAGYCRHLNLARGALVAGLAGEFTATAVGQTSASSR